MDRHFKSRLLEGCKEAGSYAPGDVLHRIEESLTGDEYESAMGFLTWVTETGRTFGHGNIDAMYEEWTGYTGAKVAKP